MPALTNSWYNKSQATLLSAQAKIGAGDYLIHSNTISTAVVVLPVPGGP